MDSLIVFIVLLFFFGMVFGFSLLTYAIGKVLKLNPSIVKISENILKFSAFIVAMSIVGLGFAA
ncbi:MAG: hypothetical protein R3230_00650 [Nitrosopumilaceae archaeon]|nr:hypothetical protein [Nitrosopumilaceae archaeon]